MHAVIFYSWQSDLPNATNRGFVQKALENAAKSIRDDESIQVEPVIDRDTEGVPGSPDIGKTIFDKIEKAQAFVCDVSLINTGSIFLIESGQVDDQRAPRPTPNPNVLIELGYALKAIGLNRVLMVMNTAFGKAEDLPFDLRTKRVITYDMPIDTEDRSTERKNLEAKLMNGLRAILEDAMAPTVGEEIQPKSRAAQAIEAIEEEKPNRGYFVRRFMEDIASKIKDLEPDISAGADVPFDELLIQAIDQSLSLVIEFAQVAEVIAAVNSSEAALAMYKGFEYIAQGYNNPIGISASLLRSKFDFHKFIGHELFVTFISFLVKEHHWDIIAEVLSEELVVRNIEGQRSGSTRPFTYLSQWVALLDERNQRLGLGKIPLHAKLLKDRHSEGELTKIVPFEQFMDADYFLFLRAELQQGKCGYVDWVPWSSFYMGNSRYKGDYTIHVPGYLLEAVSINNAEKLLRPLNVNDIAALQIGLTLCAPGLTKLYQGSDPFWKHPLHDFDANSIGSR